MHTFLINFDEICKARIFLLVDLFELNFSYLGLRGQKDEKKYKKKL